MCKTISVTELNYYVKSLLDKDEVMQNVKIVGEISNLKKHSSGHIYFSLKDDKCSLKSVIFSKYAKKINFEILNGSKIFAYGSVSCYVVSGQYQLYVCHITPAGTGEINEALKILYAKLNSEGLFDQSKKRSIPKFPNKIGLITSKTGAVIHDVSNVLARRFPIAELILIPVQVQGKDAVPQILDAIKKFDSMSRLDVIIIARGGGSVEDLWIFNSEEIVRAVASCRVPIISAIGHEINWTLCDFAADLRAPTPSAAAELASVNILELNSYIKILRQKINFSLINKISNESLRLERIKRNIYMLNPEVKIDEFKVKLNEIKCDLNNSLNKILQDKYNKIVILKNKIFMLSPKNVLSRNYTIASLNGIIVSDKDKIKENSKLTLTFKNGDIEFIVKNIKIS